MDRLTMVIATGAGIAWGGSDAYRAWQAARNPDSTEPAMRQRAALGRLQGLFANQPALRGAIRKPD